MSGGAQHGEPRTSCSSQTGFTLVEMLVTLVIVAMVAGVVFGGLQQVFNARARLRPYLDNSEQTALIAEWFRKTLQALIADYNDGQHPFAGSMRELSGLTGSPLLGSPGTPTSVKWEIKRNEEQDITVLEYKESNKTLRIMTWSGQGGAFAYYTDDGKWSADWPPPDTAQGKSVPQLPRLIRLSGMAGGSPLTVVAAPRASRVAPQAPPPELGVRRSQ